MLLLCAAAAQAMDVRSGEVVIIGPNERVADDLYVAASRVQIRGTIEGDVLVVARQVDVEGKIGGDLSVVVRRVFVRGQIGDDLRAAAAVLRVDGGGFVEGDLIAAAGAVETDERTLIGGDAALAVGQARVAGTLEGDLSAMASALRIDGFVGGDVEVDIGDEDDRAPAIFIEREGLADLSRGLGLGPNAQILGRLDYSAPSEADIELGAIPGAAVTFTRTVEDGELLVFLLKRYLGLFIVGALALLAAPAIASRAAEVAARYPLRSLGAGLAVALGFALGAAAIAAFALALSAIAGLLTLGSLAPPLLLVGLIAEMIWIALFVIAAGWLAQGAVALAAGERVVRRRFGALALGLLALVLLLAIPILGIIVGIVVALVGLGALAAAILPDRVSRRWLPHRQVEAIGME